MEIDNGEGERERIYDQLLEVVTAVLQQQMPALNAAQLLMPISSKESLQQVLVDVLWLGGFAATEVPGNKEARDEFTNFCCLLEREGVVSKPILAAGLETETLPPPVCNMSLLRKKQNQAKTKARYTVTRFNLLREHNEGYARVIMYMDRLIHLDCDVLGGSDELTKIRESIIEDIMLLIGHSYLCPNRIIAMAIDIYEKLMMEEEEPSKRPQALVSLLRRFSRERLTKIAAFLVSIASPVAGSKDVKDGKDAKDGKFDPEPRLSQFMAIASLISINVIDLRTLWSYLEPGEKKIQEAYHLLQRKYEAKLKTISVVDLSGKSNLAKDKRYFSASVKNFNQLLNKKIRMVEAMISINDWRNACIMLTIMRRICRPCMNHYLRSALCDLLKWIIQPLLLKTASSPYKSSRRFAWGLLLQGSDGPVPVCLPQATDINDFASATKQAGARQSRYQGISSDHIVSKYTTP